MHVDLAVRAIRVVAGCSPSTDMCALVKIQHAALPVLCLKAAQIPLVPSKLPLASTQWEKGGAGIVMVLLRVKLGRDQNLQGAIAGAGLP